MILKKAAGFIGLGLFLLVIFLPGYTKIQELRDKNRDLIEKYKRLKAENAQLEQMLKRFENDKLYQEKILREKAGVVRKDEVPVKFIPQD
jgi:cell division protein FtsB